MKLQYAIIVGVAFACPVYAADNDSVTQLDEVSVTATREAQSLKETAMSIGVIKQGEIDSVKPGHPSEIMQRVPGVHINVTGGEGHMTAIRQPLTTNAVYLYLEDGIPTRSTGFFNHNALYEINLPQAERIEVLKGPGSALYGSDAIGAVINVETKPAPLTAEADVTMEAGEFGWKRLLLSGGAPIKKDKDDLSNDAYRASLNLTQTDGWRDATQYDRKSATVRWDRILESGASLKTVLSTSDIDQQTAGSSRLLSDDYYNNPTLNYTPISFRKVSAFRLSTAYEKESSDSLVSVTPYFRSNDMKLLPNWALSYDPTVYDTKNNSLGALIKYRQDFKPMRSRLVMGMDIDYSPGSRFEQQISTTKVGNVYTAYTVGSTLYDYDATFESVSPYAHLEFSPSDKLRVTTGLRYDFMYYVYDNKLTTVTTGSYRRPADATVKFDHLSPKLGVTYRFSPALSGFASYRQAFRVPSEGQLFRQGKATNTLDLKPIKVTSIEMGLRGKTKTMHYEISVYSMHKKDDILTYKYPDSTRETMNAGKTLHQGLEAGLGMKLAETVSLDIAASYARHTYETWQPETSVNYNGNEMESAPRLIANTRLGYKPEFLSGGKLEFEWVKLGKYWMDAANTNMYSGHDVFNLRVNYFSGKQFEWFARVMNILDKRYATAASYTAAAFGNPEKFEYAPGMPRTTYIGMKYKF